MALDAVRSEILRDPTTVALFFDFDGTLSPIQDDPESVVPLPGVVESIETLADHIAVVAIVSGRPVSFLEPFFADERVQLSGLYGIEHRVGGTVEVDPAAQRWLPIVASAITGAGKEFGVDVVEDKTYSLTVHYRGKDTEFSKRVTGWAEAVSLATGLESRDAKQSVELHPPNLGTKGDAIDRMLGSIRAAAYFGDDVGDLPAFERLAKRAADGSLTEAATVLVAGAETPDSIRAIATDIVDGPEFVRDQLVDLASALTSE